MSKENISIVSTTLNDMRVVNTISHETDTRLHFKCPCCQKGLSIPITYDENERILTMTKVESDE
jgi:hypothetical protein